MLIWFSAMCSYLRDALNYSVKKVAFPSSIDALLDAVAYRTVNGGSSFDELQCG